MPRLLERLHTLWTALRLRLRGGAPGVFYIGGSDTMPAPLDREAEQRAIRALTAGSEDAASLLIEHNLRRAGTGTNCCSRTSSARTPTP